MNSRILVIDDEENVRDSMRAMLVPRPRDTSEIDALGDQLFGPAAGEQPPVPPPALPFHFEVDTAATGQEGLRRVQEAMASGKPYAALFVDMRMPGWDGLTTVQRIRECDKQAEVIFVTAYSDYAVRDIVARAGMNVSYHCKPFSSEEIQQLAIKSVYEWNKARHLEELMGVTARLREHSGEPEGMLPAVLTYVGQQLDASHLLLAEQRDDGHWTCAEKTGHWTHEDQARALACAASLSPGEDHAFNFETACFGKRFDRFIIVAFLAKNAATLPSEELYRVRLFLEQAQQALHNARLRQTVQQNEKMAAMGSAIGMFAHDLRSPIGAIQSASACLLNGDPMDEEFASALIRGMHHAANESLHYVQDLLEVVRGGAPELSLRPVSCREMLGELAEEVRNRHGSGKLEVMVEADEHASFMMDQLKMRRVLLNLVKNAAEALRDHPAATAPRVVLRCGVTGGRGWISVADNGPGLPDQVKNRLFDMFVTANKAGGTGFGLAIVKKFSDAHKLGIVVDTGEGGTTFTLSGFEAGEP